MNKSELIQKLRSELKDRLLYIDEKYTLGDGYDYKIIGNIIEIQLDKKGFQDNGPARIFDTIVKSIDGRVVRSPITEQLAWEDSLRWLYHHYPYGYDDNSNPILVNEDGRIIAVNYNGLKKFSILKSHAKVPSYIVINNKYKLNGEFYINKDYDNLISYIKKICAE